MKENLLGYLLNTLEAHEHRAVERELEASADKRRKATLLRRLLQPLEVDREPPAPPPDLAINTLKRAAEYVCQKPVIIPAATTGHIAGRTRWRRADVLVAASVAFFTLMMIPPGMLKLQHHQRVMACADNLHCLHTALASYERDHGRLPHPELEGPLAVAGVYAPALREAGYLDDTEQLFCPAVKRSAFAAVPTRRELEEADPDRYDLWRHSMGGFYGFHLGYRDEQSGEFRPLSGKMLSGESPVMVDRPPRWHEENFYNFVNSPNHDGKGQNVLFFGGHVRFLPKHFLGNDDLFRNREGKVAAGVGPHDVVLAPSEATPMPKED